MVRPQDKAFLSTNKVQCTKVNGKMINITDTELSNGTTTKSFTQVTSSMAKRQEKVNLRLMEMFMRATSLMVSSMEKVSTIFHVC